MSAWRRSIAPWPSLAGAGDSRSTADTAAIPTPGWRSSALTEAAQSRSGCIQGGREDLPDFAGGPPPRIDPDEVFGQGERRAFRDVRSVEHPRVADDVSWLIGRLEAAGFRQAVVVELTRADLGVPVVRVVVPRAETWAAFHLHSRRGTLGPRAIHRLTRGIHDHE